MRLTRSTAPPHVDKQRQLLFRDNRLAIDRKWPPLRRAKKRHLALSSLDSDDARYFQTVIALTKPSWVLSARLDELATVLGHIGGESH